MRKLRLQRYIHLVIRGQTKGATAEFGLLYFSESRILCTDGRRLSVFELQQFSSDHFVQPLTLEAQQNKFLMLEHYLLQH